MSSSAEILFSSEYVSVFIQSDDLASLSFSKLINKGKSRFFSFCLDTVTSEHEAIQNISKFATSLLNILNFEAANDHLNIKINLSEPSDEIIDLDSDFYTNSFFKKVNFFKIIQQLFSQSIGVNIKFKGPEWNFSWEKGNPKLGFKPVFEAPSILPFIQKKLENCAQSLETDVIFRIENNMVETHSVFLKDIPYFKKLLKYEWKDKREPIVIKGYSYRTFNAMIRFLYLFEIEDKDAADCKTVLDLYCLSEEIKFLPLKNYCKAILNNFINEKNFLTFAFYHKIFNDDFILKLCQWFIIQNPSYGSNLDISHFNLKQLQETYAVCRKSHAKEFEKVCLDRLKVHLQIDEDIDLMEAISSFEDQDLTAWFQQQAAKLEKKEP